MVSHQKYRIFLEFQFCVFVTNFSQNISQFFQNLVHYGKRTDDPFRKHILCLLWRNMSFILEVKLIITICDALCFTNFKIEFTQCYLVLTLSNVISFLVGKKILQHDLFSKKNKQIKIYFNFEITLSAKSFVSSDLYVLHMYNISL